MSNEPLHLRTPEFSLDSFLEYLQIENGVMVEIGSYTGESAECFAKSGKFKEIYCVDQWLNNYSPYDIGGTYCDMKIVEAAFDKRIKPFKFIDKIKASSKEGVKQFPDAFFDMVYIDANHDYEYALEDIVLWKPKVKIGGYLCGHDYMYAVPLVIMNTMGREPDKIFPDTSWAFKL